MRPPFEPETFFKSAPHSRPYRLHLSEGLPDGAPLVIVLHGYGGEGDPGRFDMNCVADRNVFCTGMSNGGDMCYLPASRCPEKFAAPGPIAGFMSVEILRSDRNRHPIPLFEIHGTEYRTDTLPARPGGLQVIAHRFTGGTGGGEVWLYQTVGGKHAWEGYG